MRYLMLLTLLLAGCDTASRYQIAAATNAPAAWRVDTKSGKVDYCYVAQGGVTCSDMRWVTDPVAK